MKLLELPGLIDMHVHLRDPEQVEKEDFLTGTAAALSGGFTTIFDMPNNKTPITTLQRLENKILLAQKKTVANIGFYFGSLGTNIEEFSKVEDKVFGIKLYLNETTGNFLINVETVRNIFASWESPQPILLHAEDDAVAAVIDIVRKTNKRAHFCHISTVSDLKQIMQAKKENLPISCGVTPHHLFLTEDNAQDLGSYGKMKPPLRSKEEVAFLWNNLDSIDVIESDHAPHTQSEKDSAAPPFGVPGLETTLPLLLTAAHEEKLTIETIIRLLYTGPQHILRLPDDPTTKVIVDTQEEWVIKNEDLQTKCKWTPFNKRTVIGRVKEVILKGRKVLANGRVIAKPGTGSVLSPHL